MITIPEPLRISTEREEVEETTANGYLEGFKNEDEYKIEDEDEDQDNGDSHDVKVKMDSYQDSEVWASDINVRTHLHNGRSQIMQPIAVSQSSAAVLSVLNRSC